MNLTQDWIQSAEIDKTHREHPGTHDSHVLRVPVHLLLRWDVLWHRDWECVRQWHLLHCIPPVLPKRHGTGVVCRHPLVVHDQVSVCENLQYGASVCEKGVIKCFPRVPQAVGLLHKQAMELTENI